MASVKLLKSFETSTGKKLPIGTVLPNISRANYKKVMETKGAEDYSGQIPPKNKTKSNFFKPK